MGNLPAIGIKPGAARGKDFGYARSPLLSSRSTARRGVSSASMAPIDIFRIRQARGCEFGVQAVRGAAPRTAVSKFSLTLDRLNYQFSRKALRV
jgi:hypothetical protein